MSPNKHSAGYHAAYYRKVTKPQRELKRATKLASHAIACAYCGTQARSTLEHIVPRSKGGNNAPENMIVACHACNLSRGNADLDNWRAVITRKLQGVPQFTPAQRAWLLEKYAVDVYAVDASGIVFFFEGGNGNWREQLDRDRAANTDEKIARQERRPSRMRK